VKSGVYGFDLYSIFSQQLSVTRGTLQCDRRSRKPLAYPLPNIKKAYLHFELWNCGVNVPQVIGAPLAVPLRWSPVDKGVGKGKYKRSRPYRRQ
jgi:hypothetical protein